MKKLIGIILITILLFSLILGGCTNINRTQKGSVEVVDSNGTTIVLDKEPEKVISLGPNITEIIYALGKEDNLIARTDYCDYPEDVLQKESIGSLRSPNIEKIVALEPDLVIASTHFSEENAQKLKEVGITVAYLYNAEEFEGVYEIIEKAGNLLYASKEANQVVSDMKEKVEKVQKAVEGKEKPTVYYVVAYGESGDYTATGETFIHKIIEMAGGENIASNAQGWTYSLEKIVEENPEYIICSMYHETKKGIENTNGYKDLAAVKEGRLSEINNNMIDRQGPRLADGLLEIAKILHPDSF